MDTKKNAYFWTIIERFNKLMKEAIEGPDCTDPRNCHGDCCSITIDIPKVLAEWYIEEGLAKKKDFIRSNIFSFHLRFDEKTGKCFFFDKKINGCRIHNTGRKPPQCWIYPTGFSNPSNKIMRCKRLEGWRITNQIKTQEAEKLLAYYVFLCQIEVLNERKKIMERLRHSCSMEQRNIDADLQSSLESMPPSRLGGFRDDWDDIKYLSAEGYSLQMKKFCIQFNPDCEVLRTNFLNCEHMCDKIAKKIIEYLNSNILGYIKKNGLECEGEYPLYKIFNLIPQEKKT